jgi:hypothetical protein
MRVKLPLIALLLVFAPMLTITRLAVGEESTMRLVAPELVSAV